MRTLLPLFLAVALSTVAGAADFSARFYRGIVTLGDSTGTVVKKAGRQPDRIVQLENAFGGAAGERWEYYVNDKQINIVFRDGKVVDIEDIH